MIPAFLLALGAAAAPDVTVSGFVRDAKGNGVPHVPVLWKHAPAGDDGRTFRSWKEVFTDATGRYEIPAVGPGTIEWGVGGERNNHLEPDLNPKETVAGEAIRRDFRLEGSLVFGGRVDAPGDGSVTVWIQRRAEGPGGGWSSGAARRVAVLGADRNFLFTALGPGVYDAGAVGEGLVAVRRLVSLTADVRDARFAPPRGAPVTGRVVLGPGTEDAYIDVRMENPGEDDRFPVNGVEADGTFAFANVPPGRWRVTAGVSRQLTGEDECRNLNGEAVAVVADPPVPVALPPIAFVRDEDVGIRILLPPGAGTVEGRVTIVGGGKWAWQRFAAVRGPSGETGIRPILGMASAAAYLRPDGTLRLFDLAKGRHRLRVEAPGYAVEEREVEVAGPTTVEVPLRRLPGRLVAVDDLHGMGIGYLALDVRPAGTDGPWRRLIEADERVRISDVAPPEGRVVHLEPGTYEFRATTDRHPPATRGPVAVEDARDPLRVEFAFDAGRAIAGTLRTREGGRGAERLLRVFRLEAGRPVPMPEKATAAGGDGYRIGGLAPGRYRIAVADDGAVALAEVEVQDADVRVDLLLGR